MHEDTYLFFLSAMSYIFAFIMLWIGTKQKYSWFDLKRPLSKAEFRSWWWKVLLLSLMATLLTGILAALFEILKEEGIFYNLMYNVYWCASPLYIIYTALILAVTSRRAIVLKKGKWIRPITIILLILPPLLWQMVLWILYFCLYFLPEEKRESVVPAG